MKVLRRSETEMMKIGDIFIWDGREYQIITNPVMNIDLQGGMYVFTARMQSRSILDETRFYLEITKD